MTFKIRHYSSGVLCDCTTLRSIVSIKKPHSILVISRVEVKRVSWIGVKLWLVTVTSPLFVPLTRICSTVWINLWIWEMMSLISINSYSSMNPYSIFSLTFFSAGHDLLSVLKSQVSEAAGRVIEERVSMRSKALLNNVMEAVSCHFILFLMIFKWMGLFLISFFFNRV